MEFPHQVANRCRNFTRLSLHVHIPLIRYDHSFSQANGIDQFGKWQDYRDFVEYMCIFARNLLGQN